jgi:hypothetical protein
VEYDVFISEHCTEFLIARVKKEGTRLFYEARQIGKNPFREPDFTDSDDDGEILGMIVESYALLYRIDHAAKRVLIADITYADQI